MAGLNLGIMVKGVQELAAKLEPDKMLNMPLKKLLGEAGRLVERQAKIDVPVDTGRLRASITHEVSSEALPLWARVGTKVEYASFVELGHKQEVGRYVHAIRRRLVRPFVPGKPFLHPAFEKMKDKIDSLLSEARGLIEGAWKR